MKLKERYFILLEWRALLIIVVSDAYFINSLNKVFSTFELKNKLSILKNKLIKIQNQMSS